MGSLLSDEIRLLDALEPSLEGSEAQAIALQALVEGTSRLLDADRVSLILFDWKARTVSRFLRGGPGWTEVMATVGFDELTKGLSGWVLQTGQVALSPKDVPDSRESPEVQFRRRETRCGSILVAPLGNDQRRLGTLTAINRSDQPDFTPEQARDLGLFATFGAALVHLAEARQMAATAVQSKMNFLSNLSHELRTPLNGILGFSHLLDASSLSSEQRPMVQTILQSGQRLLDTVDNILELAQFEAGLFQLEVAPFSPRAVLEAVASKFGAAAREKGIDWILEPSVGLPSLLEGDAVRLGQAWGHVLSNSVKFTHRGSITLRLSSRTSPRGLHELSLEVEDTGVGLPAAPDPSERRPFEQGDGSLTRRFGGTGLGLALCERIVRRMSGGVSLAGRPDEGTKARVWVELTGEGEASLEANRGLHILVQNSDPTDSLVLVKMLEKAGHAVDVVRDPEQILDRLPTNRYEVLLVEALRNPPAVLVQLAELSEGRDLHLVGLYPPGASPTPGVPWTAALFQPLSFPAVQEVLDRCYSRRTP